MTVELARHSGASFVCGLDQLHIWVDGSEPDLISTWNHYLVNNRIAKPLTIRSNSNGRIHAHASCYPFLPMRLLHQVIEQSATANTVDRTLEYELSDHAYDADVMDNTYAIHRRLALEQGWPAWPLMLGRMQSLILGAGRQHCLIPMNLAPSATALIGIAGMNKAVGRDLLSAYNIPVAAGGLAMTRELAVSVAERVGWPVVLKRLVGGNSDGVILNVSGTDDCRQAAAELLEGGGAILVEKKVPGIELRVHFVAGRIQQIVLRVPSILTSDGKLSLRQIIEQKRPNYFKLADGSAYFQKQLVYRLWELGVRTFSDIDRIVPPSGRRIPMGKEFHRFRDAATEARSLQPSDRRRIETFLAACGKPSGALDIILPHSGTPLAEGGAVLEINVPSGMWYLDGIEKIVRRELIAWTSHLPEFRRRSGRIPFWIAAGSPSRAARLRQLQRSFKRQFSHGKVVAFSETGNWVPILTEPAEAILVFADDDDIRRCGLPANLALLPSGLKAHLTGSG